MNERIKQFISQSDCIFEAMANNSNDYTYMWDLVNDNYIISNNFAKDFNGVAQGLNFVEFWKPYIIDRDVERVYNAITSALTLKQKHIKVEYQVTDRLGTEIWISDHSTIIFDETSGDAIMLVGSLHNLLSDGRVDTVTGLLMYNKCKELLDVLISQKNHSLVSVMLLGIDAFSSINTLNDHAFGDLVLRETAQIFTSHLFDGYLLYRYDGDQFLIVAENASKSDLTAFYDKLRAIVSLPHQLGDKSYRFTISAGIASYPQDGSSWKELEKSVSIALKKAKEKGKNQCVGFTKLMLNEKLHEQSLVKAFTDDIEHEFRGFHVVFQPVCHASSLKIKGAEILIRYTTIDGVAMRPDQFIPLLEQTQLIVPVGMWVIEQAIKTCKKWTAYIKDFVMNVNVSYLQLRDLDFCDRVEKLLADYDLDVAHLTIELTETCFITDAPNIDISMKRLQELQLQVAMDDFGTGYSSLARLAQFNVDVVKIDRSFVMTLHNSKYNHDFVDSVIRLCHNVGMKVCVEGVETAAQQESICLLNADYVQGFYVSKPIDEQQFYNNYIADPHANNHLVVIPNDQLRHDQIIGDKDVLFALMEATPLGLSFWSRNLEIIACNSESLRLFGVDSFEAFKEHFFDFSLEYQNDGSNSIEKAKELVGKTFLGEEIKVYWQHQTVDGQPLPTEVTFARIPYMGDYIVASYTRDMREQKMMEEKIESFNVRLKAILDASPLCLNLWNNKFENTLCNKAAVDLFDVKDELEYMKCFFELSPMIQPNGELSNDEAVKHIKKAFETGYEQFTWMHQKLNGEPIIAEITLVKIEGLGESGSDLVAGYTRDMRQQLTMESKIEKFNYRLKAILDATPLCLNLWNRKFENTMCNKAAVNLFDLKDEHEYMERFFDLSPLTQPDGELSGEKAIRYIKEAFEKGRAQFNWVHSKLNGELIQTEITMVKIEGLEEEGSDLVAGYTRDMRAEVESHRLQSLNNNRMRAVLDSSPIACILWTLDYKIVDCNEVAVHMLAAKDKNDITNNFDTFLPLTQPSGENSLLKKMEIFEKLNHQNHIVFEWVYVDGQQEEVPCEVTAVKLSLENESIIVVYSRDLREFYQTLELNDRLSKMAYYDLLTGVISRARFAEKLELIFEANHSKNYALLIFDLDYFKSINDNYGHPTGDKVLKLVTKTIANVMPKQAVIGRLGGDEFVILLEDVTLNELKELLINTVNCVGRLKFEHDRQVFSTSISVGATFKLNEDEDYHDLLGRADKALYAAKAKGRNGFFIT